MHFIPNNAVFSHAGSFERLFTCSISTKNFEVHKSGKNIQLNFVISLQQKKLKNRTTIYTSSYYLAAKGPRVEWWWRSPCRLMVAHKVIFALRWPGTFTMALCPITFSPHRLVLARCNVNEQSRLCSCIIVKESLLQKMHTLYFEYGPTQNTGLQSLHIHTRMGVGVGLGQTHCCQNYKVGAPKFSQKRWAWDLRSICSAQAQNDWCTISVWRVFMRVCRCCQFQVTVFHFENNCFPNDCKRFPFWMKCLK